MSILIGKRVLIVGEENSQVVELKKALEAQGINVQNLTCEEVSREKVEELAADIIFINHLHGNEVCRSVLNFLRTNIFNKVVPTFVLVEDSNDKIQEVMSYGATDYIIPQESVDDILLKIKTLLTERGNFNGTSAIDITPNKADVSSTGIRVYVIEDDPLLRNLLSITFEKSSFPYEFSRDGQQVLPIMKQFKPDIVILDLMLPGKSGFEILEEIKGDKELSSIPVVIFSNRDGQEDKQRALQMGAEAFYVKAMTDLTELIEQIEELTK